MKTVGIIAEYNPFHSGHKYHIEEARRLASAERVVCVMSASFVQRGEPACADKFTRAKWALENGADMVIELPDVFSLSCAERFASGGIRLLKASGIIDSVCFGSESGDIGLLSKAAVSDFSYDIFRANIDSGMSYPEACASAYGSPLSPNDILGTEYIRASKKCGAGFDFYAVKRQSAHDGSDLGGEFSSAYAIRTALNAIAGSKKASSSVFDGLSRALPRKVLDEISALIGKGAFPSAAEGLSDAVLYAFRRMSLDDTADLPEVSEGLENLFYKYSRICSDSSEMLEKVKSKRYTMARLKRIAACGLLGITRELQDAAAADDSGLYLRVLGFKKSSEDLMKALCANASAPVIANAAAREALPALASRIEAVSSFAHSVRALGQPYEKSVAADASYRTLVL